MEKINEELKSIQSNPRLFLANFFSDLKRDVDLFYFQKESEKAKYLEIINKIEEIEQEYYIYYERNKRLRREDQFTESQDEQTIDQLKYKIEEKIFQNKSILFTNDYEEYRSFLLIIDNLFLRQSIFDNLYESEYFNREKFIDKKFLVIYISSNKKKISYFEFKK